MGLFTNKYSSPFDNVDEKQTLNLGPRVSHLKPAKYMTTRSALFMGFEIMSLNLGMHMEENAWFVLASAVAFFILWNISFRFINKRSLTSLLGFIYIMMFGTIQYFFSEIVSFRYIFSMVPMALGLMTFTAMNKDNSEEYERAELVSECILPMVYSLAASLLAYYLNGFFEVRYFFSMNFVSVVFMMIASWALTKGAGSPYFFTSKRLSEFWDIPVSDSRNVRGFVISRGIFAGTSAVSVIVCFITEYFLTGKYEFLSRIIAMPVICVLMLIFIYLVYKFGPDRTSLFGSRFFVYEAYLAAAALAAPFIYSTNPKLEDIVLFYFLTLFVDVMVTAVFAVIRRQQIFVVKSKYLDGLPFMMVFISLFIMLIECCLYQVQPL